MGFKSDIEEIEIGSDPPQFYDYDSNSNSNFSDASSRQADRQLARSRSTKGTFLKGAAVDETSQSSAGSSTRPGRATKNSKKYISQLSSKDLKERELTEFLGDFDLSTSKRERKKQVDYSDNINKKRGGM